MIRKLNYTGRKKMLVRHARFSTVREKANHHHVNVTLILRDYINELPTESIVYVEAYTRSKVERYRVAELGRCGEEISKQYQLTGFSDVEVENIHFRVKIVDESENAGRILAIADRLPRRSSLDHDENRKSILGYATEDMGDRLWKLDLDRSDMPYLVINSQLGKPKELAKNNDIFFATVFPEVIRQVLAELFLTDDSNEDYADCDDSDDWRSLWSFFARKLTATEKIPIGLEERKEWIDDCVRTFCSMHRLLKRTEQVLTT